MCYKGPAAFPSRGCRFSSLIAFRHSNPMSTPQMTLGRFAGSMDLQTDTYLQKKIC